MIALPNEIKVLLTFLVTQGVKSLANLLGKDVSGWGSALVATVVGSIVFFVEGLLALVPADKQELVGGILSFVALLLGSFGTHYTYRNIS